MTVALIACGALCHEVAELVQRHGWDAEVVGISALHHLRPERIAGEVEQRLDAVEGRFDRVVVVYGDCGTAGALDELLERRDVPRIRGPHCYEMYAGEKEFNALADEEPGTFFLTDYLVRSFEATVVGGLGLDRFPDLAQDYFGNYRKVVYLVQREDPAMLEKADQIAAWLELPLEVRRTGYGALEQRLAEVVGD